MRGQILISTLFWRADVVREVGATALVVVGAGFCLTLCVHVTETFLIFINIELLQPGRDTQITI